MSLLARSRTLLATGLLAAACSAPPLPTPVALDPMLPPFAADATGLLSEVDRTLAAGSEHRGRRLAATFDPEIRAALLFASAGTGSRIVSSLGDGIAEWNSWLQRSAHARARDQAFARELVRCRELLAEGDLASAHAAAEEAVAETDDGPCRGIALAWRGFVAASAGRSGAREDLVAAATAMAPYSGSLTARIHLLRCSSCGDASAWLEAVATAGWAAIRQPGTADPWFWRRAAELQSTASPSPWPEATLDVMRANVPALRSIPAGDLAASGAAVWIAIGEQHRRRSESFAALIAFRKVEELASDGVVRAFARARQARALLAADRPGDARAALDASVSKETTPEAATALAMLGAIELLEERPEIARKLCERALAAGEGTTWPLFAECLANLGVASCLCGDVDTGHRALLRARDEFVRTQDVDGLLDCLANELVCARELARGDAPTLQRLVEGVDRSGLTAFAPR